MADVDETWADVVAVALGPCPNNYGREEEVEPSEPSMDTIFDCGFGGANGCAFTVWTTHRVYFPVEYDGAESVASVPRNPCDEATEHVG
jgi:hypothetical protein